MGVFSLILGSIIKFVINSSPISSRHSEPAKRSLTYRAKFKLSYFPGIDSCFCFNRRVKVSVFKKTLSFIFAPYSGVYNITNILQITKFQHRKIRFNRYILSFYFSR